MTIPIYKSGKTSQCWQDVFVYNICGNNGSYIEIGGSWPKKNSNSYALELFANYKGFSLELDKDLYYDAWQKSERKNKIYWKNALTFDYISALQDLNISTHVNYLSCDIEPPSNTFFALQTVINQGVTFDVITFEHDLYNSSKDYNILATKFLLDRGYKIAVTDVYHKNPNRFFETWFINENVDFKEQTFDKWKSKNL